MPHPGAPRSVLSRGFGTLERDWCMGGVHAGAWSAASGVCWGSVVLAELRLGGTIKILLAGLFKRDPGVRGRGRRLLQLGWGPLPRTGCFKAAMWPPVRAGVGGPHSSWGGAYIVRRRAYSGCGHHSSAGS